MPIRGSPNGGPLNPVHAFPQAIPWWTSSLGIGGHQESVRVDVINRFCWSPSLGTPISHVDQVSDAKLIVFISFLSEFVLTVACRRQPSLGLAVTIYRLAHAKFSAVRWEE